MAKLFHIPHNQFFAVFILLSFSTQSFALTEQSRKASLNSKKSKTDSRIKTVVLLMMENRSFDHMLGWLRRLRPDIDGLTGNEYNPLNVSDPSSPKIYVSDSAEFVDPDPGHSYQAIREQVFGGATPDLLSQEIPPMNGFAQQAQSLLPNQGFAERVMSGFRPEVVPVHTALAMEFAVFDTWHASMPASTQPNRMYVHSATSHGATGNHVPDLLRGFPQKTIYDSLHEDGYSFGVYHQSLPSVLFLNSLRQVKYANKFHTWSKFRRDAKAGKLPNYSFLEPKYFDLKTNPANDDHPSHDVAEGQKLLKEVYELLRQSPQWEETLLIITYDEHGGFFDHVATPVKNVPSPDDIIGPEPWLFEFDRLGVRVPTIMVSPWINKGTVVHNPVGPTPSSVFEHSSVPATVKKMFNLKSDFLTRRDKWAATFEHVFMERDSPRTDCPEELPSPPWSLRHSPPNEEAPLTEWQSELVQLAMTLVSNASTGIQNLLQAPKSMNVREASEFVEDATRRFLLAGKEAVELGVHGDELVTVEILKPVLTDGEGKGKSYQQGLLRGSTEKLKQVQNELTTTS